MTMQPYEPPEVPTPVVAYRDTDSWTEVVSEVVKFAAYVADTDFVPLAMRGNPAAVAAAILAGREMGLPPMTALQHIHVVKGRPGQSAQLMRALVMGAGHEIVYVETTDTRCVVEGRRRGESKWERVSFTADQARRAKIDMGGYPEDKLVARATARLCRRKFPDCLAGMAYATEELEDGPVSDSAPDAPPASGGQAPARRTARRRAVVAETASEPAAEPSSEPAAESAMESAADSVRPESEIVEGAVFPGGPPLPGEDGYDDEPPDVGDGSRPITRPQMTRLHATFSDLGVTERAERLRIASVITGRELSTSAEMTVAEAGALIDALAECQASVLPQAMLTAIMERAT